MLKMAAKIAFNTVWNSTFPSLVGKGAVIKKNHDRGGRVRFPVQSSNFSG